MYFFKGQLILWLVSKVGSGARLSHRSSATDAYVRSASYREKDKEETLSGRGVITFLLIVLL